MWNNDTTGIISGDMALPKHPRVLLNVKDEPESDNSDELQYADIVDENHFEIKSKRINIKIDPCKAVDTETLDAQELNNIRG